MGNSEVGHLNLGAGAVVRQDLTRIDEAVEDGRARRERGAAGRRWPGASALHLMGLVSDGGVHASLDHLRALVELRRADVPDLVLHAFTDGRDTLPHSGAGFLEQAEGWLREAGGRDRTVTGRYFAMDRDKRWDRIKLAYDAIVHGRGDAPDAAVGSRSRACRLRPRRDRRVRQRDRGGGRGADARRRFRALLQLPPRSCARADASARRARLRRVRPRRRAVGGAHDADRVPGGVGLPGRLPARRARR